MQLRGEARRLARFEMLISTLFGLARDGKTDEKGRTDILQAALLIREFEDVIRFTRPPRLLQKILFGMLAPVARLLGYRAIHPEYGPIAVVEVALFSSHAPTPRPPEC